MFGTSWKRQPCRELRENNAGLDALNQKANDTRTEDIGLTLRSRGVPQRGGRRNCHGDEILPLQTYTHWQGRVKARVVPRKGHVGETDVI